MMDEDASWWGFGGGPCPFETILDRASDHALSHNIIISVLTSHGNCDTRDVRHRIAKAVSFDITPFMFCTSVFKL